MDRVWVEEIGPHRHADVRERQEQLVVLVDSDGRRRGVGGKHAVFHREARVVAAIGCGCIIIVFNRVGSRYLGAGNALPGIGISEKN